MTRSIFSYIRNNFQYYALIVVAFFIPFTKEYLPYAMALWVLTGILSIRKIYKDRFQHTILLLFPFLFYLLHVFGLIYTTNVNNGLFDLEVKLSIFLVPLISLFISHRSKIKIVTVLKVFVLANLLVSILCLILAFQNSIQLIDSGKLLFEPSVWKVTRDLSFLQLIFGRHSWFSYSFLSFVHHPSYFSAYILFVIYILIDLIRAKNEKWSKWYYALIIYFSVFLVLLGSRAAYMTYLLVLIIFFIKQIVKYKKIRILLVGFVSVFFLLLVVFSNNKIRRNIQQTITITNTKSLNEDSDIRLWLWKFSFEIFEDNFWFGVGTGDIDDALHQKYIENSIKVAEEHNYNAHNQYFDTAIKLGVFGLIVLLLWIIYTLYITAKRKQFLFFYFMLIFAVNFMFEVMLNSIAGVGFFAFFYSLLYAKYNIKEKRA
ncbi:MAG: O-antigen ligase family protein [Bacteroidetes bacterium]|nr:O-antigen ligase family protein [Bacteroidota bacterium]